MLVQGQFSIPHAMNLKMVLLSREAVETETRKDTINDMQVY